MKTIKTFTPLTPAVFYILLALASGEKHGYEIMKQVKQDSQSQVKMGTGTLYGSLKRMLADGLIEEAGERPDPRREDERRRYYRLTEMGRKAFAAELQRYSEVVSIAQERSLLPKLKWSQVYETEQAMPEKRARRAGLHLVLAPVPGSAPTGIW